MKTVMKKMFSLLLVAVMLVSAVPVAFADETAVTCTKEGCDGQNQPASRNTSWDTATCEENGQEGYYCQAGKHKVYGASINALGHQLDDGVVTKDPTCVTYGTKTFTCQREGCSYTETEQIAAVSHTTVDATCTTAKTCSVCKNTFGEANGHTSVTVEAVSATCTETGKEAGTKCEVCGEVVSGLTTIAATGHSYGSNGVCTVCGFCDECKVCLTKTDSTFNASTHAETCSKHPDYNRTCTKCRTNYTAVQGHPTCDHCINALASSSNTCHATANCPYCTVCLKKGNYNKDHASAAHCETCGNTDGTHKVTCGYYESSGNALVRVHVRLHNGDTLIDTVELLTYRDDKGTQIGDSVSAHKSLILAELADEYPDYSWGGNLYDDPGDSQDYNEKIGEGTTVYINAYSSQDLVYIYVHNSRSMSNLRIIQLEGKKVGDTIKKSEVLSAVSKYYNVSSLSMYSEQAWEDYVDGESVESVSSLKITDDPFFIDVKISGTAKTSSGSSYTADSSNPKTGDAIFAPAAILGLSASALAVLFYLNKKRAF